MEQIPDQTSIEHEREQKREARQRQIDEIESLKAQGMPTSEACARVGLESYLYYSHKSNQRTKERKARSRAKAAKASPAPAAPQPKFETLTLAPPPPKKKPKTEGSGKMVVMMGDPSTVMKALRKMGAF